MRDITCDIGPIFPSSEKPAQPMYSYDRPAYNFWQGFAEGLAKRGLTEEQIFNEMRSKGTRWMLDEHDNKLKSLGRRMAKDYSLCVTTEK